MSEAMASDVIDEVLGIAPGSPLAEIRGQRPDVVRHTQGSYDALFDPKTPGGLGAAERLAAALRIAVLCGDAALAAHYRARLAKAGADPKLVAGAEQGSAVAGDRRWTAALFHVEQVTTRPREVLPPQIKALQEAGLTERDIVTLSQLIAFVNYQARVVAGLRLIRGQ